MSYLEEVEEIEESEGTLLTDRSSIRQIKTRSRRIFVYVLDLKECLFGKLPLDS